MLRPQPHNRFPAVTLPRPPAHAPTRLAVLPFDEPSMSALFRKIIKAEFSYPSWFSQPVKDLLNKILLKQPSRMTPAR